MVYDALANPALLQHCRSDVERIYVGKQASAHSFTQEQINDLLVQKGKQGKRVVRLKGGDPFVFGRGGEECEALHATGIPFEVVPGVTAAIAASCYAGIPVTHRDFNSSFTVITGHEKEEEYRDEQAKGAARAAPATLTGRAWRSCRASRSTWGSKPLPRIAQRLIEHGKDPGTEVAVIQWGTTPRQRTVTGTLKDIASAFAEAGITPPAMTIVGHVVSLRPIMNWFRAARCLARQSSSPAPASRPAICQKN